MEKQSIIVSPIKLQTDAVIFTESSPGSIRDVY